MNYLTINMIPLRNAVATVVLVWWVAVTYDNIPWYVALSVVWVLRSIFQRQPQVKS